MGKGTANPFSGSGTYGTNGLIASIPASEFLGQPTDPNDKLFWVRRKLRYALNPALGGRSLVENHEQSNILHLYKNLFPQEYRVSIRSREIELGRGYSPKEIEFFELVQEQLFEYDLDYLLSDDSVGARVDHIPMEYLGLSRDGDAELSDYRLGWQLLIGLCEVYDRQEIYSERHLYMSDVSDPAAAWAYAQMIVLAASAHDINSSLLPLLCSTAASVADGSAAGTTADDRAEQIAPELVGMPLALGMVEQDTGNVFLDNGPVDSYGTPGFEWDVGNLRQLAEDFKEAISMSKRVYAFLDWIEESPFNFAQAIVMWNMAAEAEAASVGSQQGFARELKYILETYSQNKGHEIEDDTDDEDEGTDETDGRMTKRSRRAI